MKRNLNLKRETLAELSATDLASVAGAAELSGPTCPVPGCLEDMSLVWCRTV